MAARAMGFFISLFLLFILLGQSEGTPLCKECQTLANDLLSTIEANSTYEWIATELENICEKVLSGNPVLLRECKKIAVDLAKELDSVGVFLGKGYSGYALCTMINLCDYYCCIMPYRPEQVHIASTGNPTEMVINFVTGEVINPTVQYGVVNCQPSYGPPGEIFAYDPQTCNFTYTEVGSSTTIKTASWQGYLHTVLLTNLSPATTYWYRVGDPLWDWSTHNFNFTTPPAVPLSSDSVTRIVAFGDMGAEDASDVNLMRLSQLAQSGSVDVILHAGDIGYANGFENVWDDYMRKIEFFAAYIPYMTAVGNHELFYNFTDFKHRFSMPGVQSGSNTNMYFSFNYGHAHIIAYSFEEDLGYAPDMHPGGRQYDWLERDLMWASSPQNRTLQPWIIMYGHRPFYCSNTGSNVFSCDIEASEYRKWIEPLIQKYSVDFVVTAHIHDYERMYPVYNGTVTSTSYENPTSAVYVVVGTGGNREGVTEDWPSRPPAWSAAHSDDIGFGYMELTNSSLSWNFYSSYKNQVIDSFTITK